MFTRSESSLELCEFHSSPLHVNALPVHASFHNIPDCTHSRNHHLSCSHPFEASQEYARQVFKQHSASLAPSWLGELSTEWL